MAQVISNAELTSGTLNGDGAFDVMMDAVKAHLEQEYINDRLKGAEYAQVYLGTITAVMQNATNFLLGQVNADKNAELIQAQIDKVNAEKALVDQQILQAEAETALAQQRTNNLSAEAANIPKQGALLDAQAAKTNEEKDLVSEQITKLIAETVNLPKVGDKLDAEVELLNQKTITEEAQVNDTAGGSTVTGLVGKQKELYEAQRDGFARDAEQKAAKIVGEVFSVVRTTDPGTLIPSSLDSGSINAIVNKMRSGIGA